MDPEEAECRSIEQVGTWGDEFEEVAIENLSVNDARGAGEEENLVA
ncbi:hypothetical protein [Edaphobacter aggregans]|nr:hypothetical protein [Edaphobacter aggregans]